MTPPEKQPATSTAEAVFERLLSGIMQGTWPPRSRLPAERELAGIMGTSRPTLREVLRRLAGWNVVAVRGGSGAVVRDRREWAIEVLPAYLRWGISDMQGPQVVELVSELLRLRRVLVRELFGVVATRVRPERLPAAREAFRQAWDARDDADRFLLADFDAIRRTVEAADFIPAVWLLNRLSSVYLDIGRFLPGASAAPDDYLTTHERLLGALARGDADASVAIMDAYLAHNDQHLLDSLGASP